MIQKIPSGVKIFQSMSDSDILSSDLLINNKLKYIRQYIQRTELVPLLKNINSRIFSSVILDDNLEYLKAIKSIYYGLLHNNNTSFDINSLCREDLLYANFLKQGWTFPYLPINIGYHDKTVTIIDSSLPNLSVESYSVYDQMKMFESYFKSVRVTLDVLSKNSFCLAFPRAYMPVNFEDFKRTTTLLLYAMREFLRNNPSKSLSLVLSDGRIRELLKSNDFSINRAMLDLKKTGRLNIYGMYGRVPDVVSLASRTGMVLSAATSASYMFGGAGASKKTCIVAKNALQEYLVRKYPEIVMERIAQIQQGYKFVCKKIESIRQSQMDLQNLQFTSDALSFTSNRDRKIPAIQNYTRGCRYL